VLPADQNVAITVVVFNGILDTLRVITVARGVNGQTEIPGEGFDSLVGAVPGAIFSIRLISTEYSAHQYSERTHYWEMEKGLT
jgi:hypothetical protein